MQITVDKLKQLTQEDPNIRLIDVRTLPEFHSERLDLDCLCNHPLDKIEQLSAEKEEVLYVICQTGNRSSQAQQKLNDAGHTNVINVEGGLNAWKAAQQPVTKTAGTFPIMRQVQLAAGSLVLIGSLGSVLVNPSLVWLSAFVGAGLTLAGATGFCGMAILLGKMPWNKAMQTA